MSQRAPTALDDGMDLSRSWTRLNSTLQNRGHQRFLDRYERSPPKLQAWLKRYACAGLKRRKIMAKALRMAIQQYRKETGRDEHGRLLRRKESINSPEDQTNKFHNRERVKVWLDECLKHESDVRSNETSEEHLESKRIAEFTGFAPEEVQTKRREAESAGEDFEDVVAVAAAAEPYDRPSVEDTARKTVEAAVEATVEPTVVPILKTSKKRKEKEGASREE
ncbi:hypothetical protein C6P46_007117 [Rhodotorula mucilaginosa]|uniref:Uncharacterized protein n=1 Tax=Rhodotorula mucilaginosa TaxID=5537 RepID=A0A9P6VX18_RHOMI|nr:hypothetical protein C6P46_007117 [Rhodotorula mucilaginosa]